MLYQEVPSESFYAASVGLLHFGLCKHYLHKVSGGGSYVTKTLLYWCFLDSQKLMTCFQLVIIPINSVPQTKFRKKYRKINKCRNS